MEIIKTQNNTQDSVSESSAHQEIVSPARSVSVQPELGNKLPVKITPLLRLLLVLVGILFLLLVLLTLMPKKTVILPTIPTPVPITLTSPVAINQLSEFAKREIFSQFETQIASVSANLQETDLTEDTLTFPLLDMNVNFEK